MLKTAVVQYTSTELSFHCGTDSGYFEPDGLERMEKCLKTLHKRFTDNNMQHIHSFEQLVNGVKHTTMMYVEVV